MSRRGGFKGIDLNNKNNEEKMEAETFDIPLEALRI